MIATLNQSAQETIMDTITIPADTPPDVLQKIKGLLMATVAKPRPIACRLRQAADILAGTRHFQRQKASGLVTRWGGGEYPVVDLHCGTMPGHRTLSVPFSVVYAALEDGPDALTEPATMIDTKAALAPWPGLMTVTDVAEALGVGPTVVRALIRAGLIPTRPARITLVHQDDLATYYVKASRQAVASWKEGR